MGDRPIQLLVSNQRAYVWNIQGELGAGQGPKADHQSTKTDTTGHESSACTYLQKSSRRPTSARAAPRVRHLGRHAAPARTAERLPRVASALVARGSSLARQEQ